MNKKLIRLTQQDLHRIVKESVNRTLNELNLAQLRKNREANKRSIKMNDFEDDEYEYDDPDLKDYFADGNDAYDDSIKGGNYLPKSKMRGGIYVCQETDYGNGVKTWIGNADDAASCEDSSEGWSAGPFKTRQDAYKFMHRHGMKLGMH